MAILKAARLMIFYCKSSHVYLTDMAHNYGGKEDTMEDEKQEVYLFTF